MFSHKNHSRIAICAFALLPLGVMQGCVTSNISVLSGTEADANRSAKQSQTISEALGYVADKIKEIDEKKAKYDAVSRNAKFGTFAGTLGLGAAGIFGAHKDTLLGLAAISGTSYQLGSLSATDISRQNCREAIAALVCIGGLAMPLKEGFSLLEDSIGRAGEANSAQNVIDQASALLPKLGRWPDEKAKLSDSAEKLKLKLQAVQPLRGAEAGAAYAIHANAIDVVFKLEKALEAAQPTLGAFQVSAKGIFAEAQSVATAASGKAGDAKVAPNTNSADKPQGAGFIPPTPGELEHQKEAIDLIATINHKLANIDLAIAKLKNAQTIDPEKAKNCLATVGSAIPTLVVNPSKSVEMKKVGDEIAVVASGGTGAYFGTWIGDVPSSDLLSLNTENRPNGRSFTFKQKGETKTDLKFKYQIVDTANVPQTVELDVSLKAEVKKAEAPQTPPANVGSKSKKPK